MLGLFNVLIITVAFCKIIFGHKFLNQTGMYLFLNTIKPLLCIVMSFLTCACLFAQFVIYSNQLYFTSLTISVGGSLISICIKHNPYLTSLCASSAVTLSRPACDITTHQSPPPSFSHPCALGWHVMVALVVFFPLPLLY